ncbi:MAG: deoxyribodipyrimidine photo-lyase [Nitrososphaeraceae archaeon]
MSGSHNEKSLFIFRRDLRLDDNTGLKSALSQAGYVIPCFILDEQLLNTTPAKQKNNNAIQFMIESLRDLDQQLKQKNSRLCLFFGKTNNVIKQLVIKENIGSIHFNDDYTVFSKTRDVGIYNICKEKGVKCFRYSDLLLINDPRSILKLSDGKPYTVFTHFFNKATNGSVFRPQKNTCRNYFTRSNNLLLEEIEERKKEDVYQQILKTPNSRIYSRGGRSQCLIILKNIKKYGDYPPKKDFPAEEATTGLSAHNKFGTCSIREIFYAVKENLGNDSPLLRQLYWRDFFTYIAYHFPYVFKQPFQLKYNMIKWMNDIEKFKLWCSGKTGFPIVDAGMRQLNTTGFMHNRVRLIVASFLTKDLHIDWRLGERYFAEKLVDYDPCVNNGNWQWAASTGCDAQPYFRIFNPWLQQKKFDPQCKYIKKFVPELLNIHPKLIHELHKNIKPIEQDCDYPLPMVDHKSESRIAIRLYTTSRKKE